MLWNSPTAKRATEIARKYLVTEYKFLVYWILKARNVVVNQTRWRSPIFHSTDPRISATSRFISQNSMVHSLARSRQWRIVGNVTDWQTSSPGEIRVIFLCQMCDVNESHDGHMWFRLENKFSFVNGKKYQSRLFCVVSFGHVRPLEVKKISSGIFSHLNIYATPSFPLSRWERQGLLNQYEQYFRRLQRARTRTLFLLQRTHIRSIAIKISITNIHRILITVE